MSNNKKADALFCGESELNSHSSVSTQLGLPHLKYPRRNYRSIDNQRFNIQAPAENRSRQMQHIKTSGTNIEFILENELIRHNIYYTKPEFIISKPEGKPDFVIPRYQIAIFCDGDFWHGYKHNGQSIKSNQKFWNKKIEKNKNRDIEVNAKLKAMGWKVLRFWEHEIIDEPATCIKNIQALIKKKHASLKKKCSFTFVDLFAGIGGFRIALEQLGGKCLGFSEVDANAIDNYKLNFIDENNDSEEELGDITKLGKLSFSDIDLIVGGVPCQSWSVAGKMRGFDDPRGKLWGDTLRLVKLNQPKAFIFENVKGLIDPRNRESLNLIISSFQEAGYIVPEPSLLNSYDFGVPQNRDRIFIVGFRKDISNSHLFTYPSPLKKKSVLSEILDACHPLSSIADKKKFNPRDLHGEKVPRSRNRFQKEDELNDFFIFCDTRNGHTTIHSWDIIRTSKREKEICMTILRNRRKKIYGSQDGNPLTFINLKELIPKLQVSELEKLINKKILRYVLGKGYLFVNSKNSAGINGIYRIYLPHSDIFSTLTATGTKDMVSLRTIPGDNPETYKKTFIKEIYAKKLFRPITSREAGKLQGFPDCFAVHEKEQIAKKQFGNAVSVPVVRHLAKKILGVKGIVREKK